MSQFVIKNKTSSPVILPNPVGRTLKPNESINLAEFESGADILAIANTLNTLEQAGTIDIQEVSDDLASIKAAAGEAGDMSPVLVAAVNDQVEVIQFNHRGALAGTVAGGAPGGAGVELSLCITDSDGTPMRLWEDLTMTVTASLSGIIDNGDGSPASVKLIKIVNGMGNFTLTDAVGETTQLSISGTPPNHPVFGNALDITDTQDVLFA